MRNPKRIPLVLKHINWEQYFNYLGFSEINVNNLQLDTIESCWKTNPDFRLTQVLMGLGIVYNKPGAWFKVEEEDYLINIQKINQDILKIDEIE